MASHDLPRSPVISHDLLRYLLLASSASAATLPANLQVVAIDNCHPSATRVRIDSDP